MAQPAPTRGDDAWGGERAGEGWGGEERGLTARPWEEAGWAQVEQVREVAASMAAEHGLGEEDRLRLERELMGQCSGQQPGQQPGQDPGHYPGQRPGQEPEQRPGQDPGQRPGQPLRGGPGGGWDAAQRGGEARDDPARPMQHRAGRAAAQWQPQDAQPTHQPPRRPGQRSAQRYDNDVAEVVAGFQALPGPSAASNPFEFGGRSRLCRSSHGGSGWDGPQDSWSPPECWPSHGAASGSLEDFRCCPRNGAALLHHSAGAQAAATRDRARGSRPW